MKSAENILLDILHIYTSPVVAQFPASAKRNLYATGWLAKWKSAFRFMGRHFKDQLKYNAPYQSQANEKLSNKHWFFVLGNNNYNSIHFLEKSLRDHQYVSPYQFRKEGVDIFKIYNPGRFRFFLKDFGKTLKLILNNSNGVRRCWDALIRAAGSYQSAKLLLEKHPPRSIIFSNDHTIEARSYALAAYDLGIPTFFIQHACVRPDFPPLCFSLNLLEGEDALIKYQLSGSIKGKVKLIGVPRIDPFLEHKNTAVQVQNIGICSNTIDSISAIEQTINLLCEKFPTLEITYRPHPSDSRSLNIDKQRVKVSNSKVENPFEFLVKQDLIIAGNTSIHYEAAILNVVPVYFKFDKGGKTDDMYDFVKNGLVKAADSKEDLIKIIQRNSIKKDQLNEKASYYHALLGTTYEGKSEEFAAQEILNHLKSEKVKNL